MRERGRRESERGKERQKKRRKKEERKEKNNETSLFIPINYNYLLLSFKIQPNAALFHTAPYFL